MTALSRYRMNLPQCRFCGREWIPASYVSADASYCKECEPERAALARSANPGLLLITGRDGSKVVLPVRGGYGLRDAKKA